MGGHRGTSRDHNCLLGQTKGPSRALLVAVSKEQEKEGGDEGRQGWSSQQLLSSGLSLLFLPSFHRNFTKYSRLPGARLRFGAEIRQRS